MVCTASIFREEKFVWIELKSALSAILVRSHSVVYISRATANMDQTAGSLMKIVMVVEEALAMEIVIVTGDVAVIVIGVVIVIQEEEAEMLTIAETPEEMTPVIEEIPEEMILVSAAEEMIANQEKTQAENVESQEKMSAVILEEIGISMIGTKFLDSSCSHPYRILSAEDIKVVSGLMVPHAGRV
jgi:hypothetical protein